MLLLLLLLTGQENDGVPELDREVADVLLLVLLPISPPSVIRVLPLNAEELLLLLLLLLLLVIRVVGEVSGVAEDDGT